VPLVDVQAATRALWQELGPDETKKYFLWTDDGRQDDTHFQPPGAAAVALLVARGLVEADVLRGSDVRRLDQVPAPDWFTWLPEPAA
jgi:hypothetical protein